MVCCQVFGNHDHDHRRRRSQGHFELNVYKPVIALRRAAIDPAAGRRGALVHRPLRRRHPRRTKSASAS